MIYASSEVAYLLRCRIFFDRLTARGYYYHRNHVSGQLMAYAAARVALLIGPIPRFFANETQVVVRGGLY